MDRTDLFFNYFLSENVKILFLFIVIRGKEIKKKLGKTRSKTKTENFAKKGKTKNKLLLK